MQVNIPFFNGTPDYFCMLIRFSHGLVLNSKDLVLGNSIECKSDLWQKFIQFYSHLHELQGTYLVFDFVCLLGCLLWDDTVLCTLSIPHLFITYSFESVCFNCCAQHTDHSALQVLWQTFKPVQKLVDL